MQQTIPVNDAYIESAVGTTPSTGPFTVDFPFFSLNDVTVARRADGSDIQEVLTRGADYDLAGIATEDGSFSGGTVTLYLAVANTTVIRFRNTPVERLSNFPLQGFFSRLALNAELNRITVWMQELNAMLGSTTEANQAHAPLNSPFFIGDPRAPTPLPGDNDTSLATTAFVNAALAGVGAAIPPGVVADYAGASAPAGWLMCQGQTLSRTAYAGLFAAIGTTWNVGGEAANLFRLPDLRGRVTAGPDAGGSDRLNLRLPGSASPGAAGGVQEHILSAAEMPYHGHAIADPGHLHAIQGYYVNLSGVGGVVSNFTGGGGIMYHHSGTEPTTTGISITPNGASASHINVQPTLIINKIIKT